MDSLSEILSGAAAPGKTETPANAPAAEKAEPAKGEKPAEAEKPAASAPPAEQAKTEVTPEPKAADKSAEEAAKTEGSQPRDEKGKFAKPEEKLDDKEPKEGGEDTVVGLRNALHAARKQKQDADRRAKEAEQRALEAAKPKTETPKKDFWDDPESAIDARILEAQRTADARYFNLCESFVKREHADYEEIVGELIEETDADAALATQVFAAAKAAENPAEYLYKTAKNRREMKAIGGDLGKFKESITEPFKAQLAEKDKVIAERDTKLAEQAKQIQSLQSQLDKLGKVPASLNTEPSASRATVDAESAEAPSLASIVEPKKRRA